MPDTLTQAQLVPPTQSAATPIPSSAATSKRQRCFELVLVIAVAFSSSMVSSFYALHGALGTQTLFDARRYVLGIIQETAYLFLLVYVLSRTGRKLRDIGMQWSLKDLAIGIGVTVAAYVAYLAAYQLILAIHYAATGVYALSKSSSAIFGHAGFAAVPFVLLNPFFEELLVRAYVMTEVIELSGSAALAIFLSTAIQFSYHLYYGWAGALSLSAEFLVFSAFFAILRRALPVIVAHGIFDLIGLARMW
jgi:hypothetical protein